MPALNDGASAFVVEQKEYALEELSTKLGSPVETIQDSLLGLVAQGLATVQTKQNPASNTPVTFAAFSFVGIVSYEDLVIRSLPKFFAQEECSVEALNSVVQAIFKLRFSSISPHSAHEKSLDSVQGAMDEAVFFVADYLQNGEYPPQIVFHDSVDTGDIDWERTIAERTPWISDGSAVYLDPVMTYAETDEGDFCRLLHLAIVSDCYRFLKSVGIAEVIGIGLWPPTDQSLADLGEPTFLLNKIRSERQVQFNDRRIQLLSFMEKHVERKLSLRNFDAYGFFGTSHFEIAWESLCAYAFANQRDKSLSLVDPSIKLPKRNYPVSMNSSMKDLIEKPRWVVRNGSAIVTDDSGGKLNPDILLVRSGSTSQLVILDAKYYALRVSEFSVSNQPGIEDVVKQYAYQMALQDFANKNNLEVRNAFLFPTSGASRVIGSVFYDALSNFSKSNLQPIRVVMINMLDMISFYLGNDNNWPTASERILDEL